jgi:hypothetical protein
MEFSYRITEDDYVRGCKIALKSKGSKVFKVILFWALIVIVLTILFGVVQKYTHSSDTQMSQTEPQPDSDQVQAPPSHPWANIAANVGPLVAVIAVWGFLLLYWLPNATRRQYRKDTNSHGIVTVALDGDSFAFQSSVGISLRAGWNAFKDWREKDGLVVLQYPAGTFQFLNVARLSEAELQELRDILTVVLPRKK